jgi:hypothetical protein
MNWSNSALSLAIRSRSRKSRNSRCSSLLLEAAQRLGAVLVERAVAARPVRRLPPGAGVPHTFGALLPSGVTFPACHSSAPYDVGQEDKTHRPPDDEAQDHQHDPGRLSELVEFRCDGHPRLTWV